MGLRRDLGDYQNAWHSQVLLKCKQPYTVQEALQELALGHSPRIREWGPCARLTNRIK